MPRLFWKLLLTCAGMNILAVVMLGVVLSIGAQNQVADLPTALRWIWASVAIESVVVFGLAYWITGRFIRPIGPLNAAAAAIAAGNYQHRIYVPNRDELGTLASTLNRMSNSLNQRMSQLSETAARQSTVLGGMIEGVIAVDARQRIVLANAAAGRVYGFRAPEAEGRPLLEVVRSHALNAAVTAGLSSGEAQRLTTEPIGAQKLCVDIHIQPLPGTPCPGVVLVIHDTTELRRLESIRRDFIANVSHELKTPLSSIKAYAETLQNGVEDPEKNKRFLGRIEEQADRLHHLILDMIMLARIESDDQSFEIVSVDVADVVRNCLESQRPAAEAKHITLVVEPTSTPSRVRADREAFREILDNLIDNALKYTPDGGTVTINWKIEDRGARSESNNSAPTLTSLNPQPSTLNLSVTDTGIGIKPVDLERIFERFYRVDKARSRELGSTGLGLAIVKHLVQSFDGQVSVQSTPGQGSTFKIEFPTG
jgi:two-component system phosphate regulon sensor histidine kinase PhoR